MWETGIGQYDIGKVYRVSWEASDTAKLDRTRPWNPGRKCRHLEGRDLSPVLCDI